MTCAPKFGSTCQVCASLGRIVMTTLPRISALALIALMLTLPMRLAASAPSSPPMASPTAPVAFEVSEPVTLSLPVIGVVSDSTSCVPVARIGPRVAVQPMSASCSSCDTGLSALPAKFFGAARSAASRMAVSEIEIGAITTELRGAGGSGGNCASCGAASFARGDSQSIAFRLTKNETATTTTPSRIVRGRTGSSGNFTGSSGNFIVPPDS